MTNNLPQAKKSRPGGRPKLSADEKRVPYGVRLSARERSEAEQQAADQGVEFSVFCRAAILGQAISLPVPKINREAWNQLSGLAETIEDLLRAAGADGSSDSILIKKLVETDEILRSTRLAVLGIHSVVAVPA